MINSEKFSKRLEKIMDHYGETASSFAERIGVQRSSISHIISGRNKPSLDFVLKILSAYPDVEMYWLLNGKGSFPSDESSKETEIKNEISSKDEKIAFPSTNKEKPIEKIVIFYKDGTFKSFVES